MKGLLYVFLLGFCMLMIQCKKAGPEPSVPDVAVDDSTEVEQPTGSSGSSETMVRVDRGFEKVLIRLGIDKLGKEDGKVRLADVKDIETLTIRPAIRDEVEGLKGIEHFVSLKKLVAMFVKPDSLDLSKNIKLEYLQIQTGFEVAGERKSLKYLNLTKCPELQYLDCRGNMLDMLDLRGNPKLRTLNTSDNYRLMQLDLSHNPALEVLQTPDHEEFRSLDVSRNLKLRRLASNSSGLRQVDVSMLADLTFLYMPAVGASLSMGSKQKLDTLIVGGKGVESIDFRNLPNLKSLRLSNLTKVPDLSSLKSLVGISIGYSDMEEFTLSGLPMLKEFVIHGSSTIRLDLSGNPNLVSVLGGQMKALTEVRLRGSDHLKSVKFHESPLLTRICVPVIPSAEDANWFKPNQASFVVCD